MQESTATTASPHLKKNISWLMAIVIVSITVALGCGGVCITAPLWFDLSFNDVITEQDYASNAERLNYINGILPITLPARTAVTRFHQEGFQDWFLNFEGAIPPQEIDAFIQSLPALDEPSPNSFEG